MKTFSGRVLLFFVCFSACCNVARADDASRRAKAEEMLQLLHMDTLYGQMMTQMEQLSEATVKQFAPPAKMTDQDKKYIDAYRTKVNQIISEEASWAALKPEFVKLYAETYTDEELDGIIAFYKSPAGQAVVLKTPELLRSSSSIAMQHTQVMASRIQKAAEDLRQQMRTEQKNAPGKS